MVAALATVGIVGALVSHGLDSTDEERTLSGGSDTSGSPAEVAADGAAVAGGPATRSADATADRSAAGSVVPSPEQAATRQAASYLPIEGLDVPQTYRATLEVLGWRDRATRLLEVRVTQAELLGPIDPATGEPAGVAAEAKLDRSGYVEGQTLLVTVTEEASTEVPAIGPAEVHLVFVPSGDGAVFWIDKVVE